MQLMLFLSINLDCTKEDCEILVNVLKTLIKQLGFDKEVVCEILFLKSVLSRECVCKPY